MRDQASTSHLSGLLAKFADRSAVIGIVGLGFTAYYPGPGPGGHTIPLDPFYLSWKARQCGLHTRLIELAGEINSDMPHSVVSKLADALNQRSMSVKGSRILVLGIASNVVKA